MSPLRIFSILLLAVSISSCSIFGGKEDELSHTKNWSAKRFYKEAKAAMNDGDYSTAITYYEALEARYPFGTYATQGQMDVAYTYYLNDEPDSAIAAANRFIRLHPRNPGVEYAIYLKGLVNFNRSLGFLDRFVPTDQSQRDPGSALNSFKDFAELIRRYPDSEYAPDAQKRMIYLKNILAEHELHVADFYMRRGAYLAAANRANYIVEHFDKTPSVKPALQLAIAAYFKLGKEDLAKDTYRVYKMNEDSGVFVENSKELPEDTIGRQIWDYLELDKN
ncbi:MAG: outer membrane protein assembly factor BamD [gamma proteobacterium symbiont of Bathyaustriella thionipta]|nr:outer membrane protein assembly factor BamD [gamma proteobacterium symbiont of Bathyaustriella thionipta]